MFSRKHKFFKNKYFRIIVIVLVIVSLILFSTNYYYDYAQQKNLGYGASGESRHFIVYGHGYPHTGEFLADTILVKSVFNDWEKETKGSGVDPLSYQLLNSYRNACSKKFGKISCNEIAKKELEAFNLPDYRVIILSREKFNTYSSKGTIYISAPKPLAFIPEEELLRLQKFISQWLRKNKFGYLE